LIGIQLKEISVMKPNNLIASFLTALLSQSASAVIIEGSFSATPWEHGSSNMGVTPDAKFWSDETNGFFLTGTFWYDTEVSSETDLGMIGAGPAAIYSGSHNWLHTTLNNGHGGSIELTSGGNSATFNSNPREAITVAQDYFEMTYDDHTEQSQRFGGFFLDATDTGVPFINGISLIQDFSFDQWSTAGQIYFKNRGTANGVEYSSFLYGQIDSFEIHVKQPIAVSEPSQLLLILIGAFGLVLQRFRKNSLKIKSI
jgi:hypothetical protein